MAKITWVDLAPLASELAERRLAAALTTWLQDWSDFSRLVSEISQRRYVAFTGNTTDSAAEQQYNAFLDEIYPAAQAVEQQLKQKLLASRLQPAGMEIPVRNMRLEADLFRAENLPLLSQELKLANEYDQIIGAQTVPWEGRELTIAQLKPVLQEPERLRRESAWRLMMERQLADRAQLNDLWQRMLSLRQQLARNAGKPNYLLYRWQQMLRADYTPADCLNSTGRLKVWLCLQPPACISSAASACVERLRTWDLEVDPDGAPSLRPYREIASLVEKTADIFQQLDPQLGAYFNILRGQNLLDLDNRKSKAPGGYCTSFDLARQPFIFMNGVGIHEDVLTLLHEAGHAFHVFETAALPYHSQLQCPLEFMEVASTSMELLCDSYLTTDQGGFYTPQEAARARIDHLGSLIRFWPYMAVVDAFQHWAYTNAEEAMQPANCDAQWLALSQRFMPDVDWSGFEDALATGWQRLHIFGSVLLCGIRSLTDGCGASVEKLLFDQSGAIAVTGMPWRWCTEALPELYRAAGAKLVSTTGRWARQ
jgi:oligoendopeptidase F